MKLRASCDNCSASKVGCTQERPVCNRCAVQGTFCNYSQSMRRGKPKGVRRPQSSVGLWTEKKAGADNVWPISKFSGALASPYCEQLEEQTNLARDPSHPPTTQAVSDWSTPSLDIWEPNVQSAAQVSQGQPIVFHPLVFANPDNSWPSSRQETKTMLTDVGMDESPSASAGLLFHGSIGDLPSSLASPTSYPGYGPIHDPQLNHQSPFRAVGVRPIGNASTEATSNDGPSKHDCVRLSISSMHDLFNATNHLPKTVEQVLETTQPVMHTLQLLLKCTERHGIHFPLLLATLISKVLEWYQALNVGRAPSPTEHANGLSPVMASHVPLMLGKHKLEADDERHLKTQLVLYKLSRVDKLVEMFAQRFCEAQDTNEGSQKADNICCTLSAYLRQMYAETIGAM